MNTFSSKLNTMISDAVSASLGIWYGKEYQAAAVVMMGGAFDAAFAKEEHTGGIDTCELEGIVGTAVKETFLDIDKVCQIKGLLAMIHYGWIKADEISEMSVLDDGSNNDVPNDIKHLIGMSGSDIPDEFELAVCILRIARATSKGADVELKRRMLDRVVTSVTYVK